MAENKRIDAATGTPTVGHEWDGIEELDTPMPRWWLYTLYATIAWGIVFVILYPAWPLVDSATRGWLGWSSRGQYESEVAAEEVRQAPVREALSRIPIERLSEDSQLMQSAIEGGRSLFKVHCVQCHGSGAAGSRGYPNLNDDDWLWGGSIDDIHKTIGSGIRSDQTETRASQMPRYGIDKLLDDKQISDTAEYVLSLSGRSGDQAAVARGRAIFAEQCASCHGTDGKGKQEQGAPNLTDAIWLYGDSRSAIVESIRTGRGGMMPAWAGRLEPETLKALAVYVHSLGGGK
jgi:cytochrome c oxidase cbb3-type subunit 3